MAEYTREPCPWVIIDDCGGSFAMGSIGGAVFASVKGFRSSPSGVNKRLIGSLTSVRLRAPVYGGKFAAWGACFSTIECTLAHIRKKEDHLNSVMGGALSAAILAARGGTGSMIGAGVIGGVLLAMIAGAGIMFTRLTADHFNPNIAPMPDPSQLPPKNVKRFQSHQYQ